ncbi:MAG: aspartate aminotransferase family protein [Pseudomonadota bacterium]|nr:aspartate aminotransferase family protein [Pseudomonadota bacterium]
MNTYNQKDIAFKRGDGVYLWDINDKKYLDVTCGLAVTALGHSHPEINEVIYNQSKTLIHTTNAFIIEQQEKLAKRLCQLSGMDKAFFCNSGAEAIETSIKISRKFGNDQKIFKPKIMVVSNSFHGRTTGALTATGNMEAHQGFEPLLEGFVRVPYNDIKSINAKASKYNSIVAILIEPIQGEGGIVIPDENYLKEIREICNNRNWLMMIDEVQSGLCRTGKWFAFQHSSILPDVITVAKALGNGIPIGACLARGSASEVLIPGSHGSTFGGNFLSTSVALKVLDIMRDQAICENAKEMGSYFQQKLIDKFNKHKSVKEIRCKGLMIGIELIKDCSNLVEEALKLGLVINVTKKKIIRLLPPLIIKKHHIDEIIIKLETLLK